MWLQPVKRKTRRHQNQDVESRESQSSYSHGALSSSSPRRVDSRANSKRQRPELRSPHLHLEIDDKSGNQAKRNLRDDKPRPVDSLIQNRADDRQAPNAACPSTKTAQ